MFLTAMNSKSKSSFFNFQSSPPTPRLPYLTALGQRDPGRLLRLGSSALLSLAGSQRSLANSLRLPFLNRLGYVRPPSKAHRQNKVVLKISKNLFLKIKMHLKASQSDLERGNDLMSSSSSSSSSSSVFTSSSDTSGEKREVTPMNNCA